MPASKPLAEGASRAILLATAYMPWPFNQHVNKPLACSLLLALASHIALATPRDWCIRPEARDYRTLDLKPGSGVKTVVYPRSAVYGDQRETYSLSADGLLRSIRRELPKQDCLESFVRDESGALLERTSTCTPKQPSTPPTTYKYSSNGWSETNDKGTEVTTVEPVSSHGATWRVRWQNVDRTWPTPPGSFEVTHFDDTCREVGPHSFLEWRIGVGAPAVGPPITLVSTITPTASGGYARIALEGSRLKEKVTVGDHGFVLLEQFFDPSSQRSPFGVQETVYKLDTRRNWTSKAAKQFDMREGRPPTQEIVMRELSYH